MINLSFLAQNMVEAIRKEGKFMSNKRNNRPEIKKQNTDTEHSSEINIRSEITQKDLAAKKKNGRGK